MNHPVYHLRPNKAIDRQTLIDAIRRFVKLADLAKYTYYGLGGPYLEDFRLLYELCPELKMVSIEVDKETVKRQEFHLPCSKSTIRLENKELSSFLAQYQADDMKSIFWLDYTGIEYRYFEDFMSLLEKVAAGSMIKITLRAQPSDFIEEPANFREKFEAIMPNPSADPPRAKEDFAYLVQEMLQISAQRALPGAVPLMFQPISSFYYSDGVGMLTLTGVVCMRTEESQAKNAFQGWELANLNWGKPKKIDVPNLSTKERLHLQKLLPCESNAGRTLCTALGYFIDENRKKTEFKLKQYADFHRYFPYFMKAIP